MYICCMVYYVMPTFMATAGQVILLQAIVIMPIIYFLIILSLHRRIMIMLGILLSLSMQSLPLLHSHYVRSGGVSVYYGALRYAGIYGYFWSRTSHLDARNAYYLSFNSSEVDPLNSYVRYFAFAVPLNSFM